MATIESNKTEREIPAWLNYLELEITALEQHIKEISPIIGNQQLVAPTQDAPDVSLCLIADQLRSLTRRIMACNDILHRAQV